VRMVRDPDVGEVIVVTLRVENHDTSRDIKSHAIDSHSVPVPQAWVSKRGEIVRTRYMTTRVLAHNLTTLLESYSRYNISQDLNFPLTWLNSEDFESAKRVPALVGSELNGAAMDKLFQEQEKLKQQPS